METRDTKIKKLEKELEAFHRSIEIQIDYEKRGVAAAGGSGSGNSFDVHSYGGGVGSGAPSGGSEATLRSLYYELGKRQTDSHSLAVALADSNSEMKKMQEQLAIAIADKKQLQLQCESLQLHNRDQTKQAAMNQDDITQLMTKLGEFKEMHAKSSEEAGLLGTHFCLLTQLILRIFTL